MEVSDNVVINRRIMPSGIYSIDDMIKNIVKQYDRMPYIPDHTIIALHCSADSKIPDSDYFDTEAFRASCGKLPDMTMLFFGSVQLAAYCLQKGRPITPDNIKALEGSRGYAAFRDMQADNLWRYQDKLLLEYPHKERHDDWSFVFDMTKRKFSETEKQDILTLGLIMSTGIEKELYTPARVPSYHLMKPHFDRLSFMSYGCNLPPDSYKIFDQCKKLKVAAGKILADKYPEVAPTMHERCGLPSGTPGNEAYALVGASGDVVDCSSNRNPLSGFYAYLFEQVFLSATPAPKRGHDYTFYRYRSDDPSLFPPAGLTEQQMWERLQKTATECGIEPMDSIPFTDAFYCLQNGRNPLHPDNSHSNLQNERRCQFYNELSKFRNWKEPEPEIHIETDAFVPPRKGLKI